LVERSILPAFREVNIMKETNVKIWAGVIALSLASIIPAAASPTLTVLHKFGGTNAGDDPDSLIQASDGNFYGTTYLNDSIVFKITPAGQFTLLFTAPYNPNGTNHYPDGNTYTSIVEGPDGFLYVVGSTIFKISKSGTGFQLLEAGGRTGSRWPRTATSMVRTATGYFGSPPMARSLICLQRAATGSMWRALASRRRTATSMGSAITTRSPAGGTCAG
jgi:hypothetical protein